MNNSVIEFEKLKEKYLTEILKIYNYYVKNITYTFHINQITIDKLKESILINNIKYPSYIIKKDKQICGYCYLTKYKNKEAYEITAEITIYLKSDFVGLGIGGKAIDKLENEARNLNYRNLIATIAGDNQTSLHLFKKKGFVLCGHLKNIGFKKGKLHDVFVLQKELI